MAPVEHIRWRLFGLLLRFIGGALLFVGVVAVVAGLGFLFDKYSTVPVEGGRTNDPLVKAIFPAVGFVMMIVGALLLLGYPLRRSRKRNQTLEPNGHSQGLR